MPDRRLSAVGRRASVKLDEDAGIDGTGASPTRSRQGSKLSPARGRQGSKLSTQRSNEESEASAPTLSSPLGEKWRKVRTAVQSVTLWKKVAKRTATVLSDNGEPLDAGSLTSFIKGNKFKSASQDAASDGQAPTPPSTITVSRPSGPPPMHMSVRTSLSLSPRRRVRRLGDQITVQRADSPRLGSLSARCTPLPDRCEGRVDHPLRWGSPLGSSPTPQPPDETISQPASPPVSPELRRGFRRELRTPEDMKDTSQRQSTNFTLAITKGFKLRPKDSLHPMLCSVVKAEGEDGKSTNLSGMNADAHAEDEGVHISNRLEKLRSKEPRRGNWTQQAEITSDRHLLLQESPRPQALATARQLWTDVQFTSAPMMAKEQQASGDGTRTVFDFRKFVSLVSPEEGQDLSPDAFMPLMFWFGLTQKRRCTLAVFQISFGPGAVPVNWILQLSQHYKVQVQLAEGFHVLARKHSYYHLCEFLSDQKRLREWYSSMTQDVAGRVGVMDVSILLAQLDVPFDKKQLWRFLSSFTEVYNQVQLKLDGNSRTSEMKNRLTYSSFSALLCRCIVTWCINRTLDLVDPPNKPKADPLENLPSKSAEVTSPEQLEAMADPKTTKRWAEVHRQILVSLLVNHRFWGRESRNVLATMSQPGILSFGQQLSPEGWLGLFQRVRAQGMASTFPDEEEERDPYFLQKKALSSVVLPPS
mmetsp:Transcript_39039/g.71183  ORF Transcript_39039/g.71183 Transcript_39039/m.71183 type:complete len:700 (-) Transcript_39039:41-2140(-)